MVIIAQGRLMYDGSLAGIVDRFSGHKVLTLQFAEAEDGPPTCRGYGEVARRAAAQGAAEGRARPSSPTCWPASWPSHTVADVSVEDPPLEEVIAEAFAVAADVSDSQELARRFSWQAV